MEAVKKKKKDDNASSSQKSYPRNTTVIAGDSIINGDFECRFRRKNHIVKVRNFRGTNVEDIRHNILSLISQKLSHLIIHAGTNDA